MINIDWNDSQTLWLNLTNAALGFVTILCGGVILKGILAQLGVFGTQEQPDHHVLNVPGLGVTMADGGEPVEDSKPAEKK